MKNTKNDLTLGSVVALLARIAKLDSEVSALTTDRDELRVELATKDERIAELEKDNDITHENLAWYMEKYNENLTIIAQLEKSEAFLKDAVDRAIQDTEYYQEQLAALQAKREPLSEQQILDCAESTWHRFDLDNEINFKGLVNIARAIEAAHNIGVNHE